jgi:hypothetical protein
MTVFFSPSGWNLGIILLLLQRVTTISILFMKLVKSES